MDLSALQIAPRIEEAETLPGWVYASPEVFELAREGLFREAWISVGSEALPRVPGEALPLTFAPGLFDEPLVLIRGEDDELRCLSNVCTHRGMLLLDGRCQLKGIRCRYHGRRFGLDGAFRSMPEFQDAESFPRPSDDLPRLELGRLGPLAFTSLAAGVPFEDWLGPIRERLSFLPWDELRLDAEGARTYRVEANWALYCENFLEGFHIPYVHPALAGAIDYGSYRTELFEWGTLQLGVAQDGELAFELPSDHPDAAEQIAAYYYWLFPTTMLNVYPWGVSLNVVEPLGPDRTRVRFLPYVWRAELAEQGAGAGLDRVEREDEAIVEAVQRGVSSRLYERGRYSPRRERGVHHFHCLLSQALRRRASGAGGGRA
ncbi:MAG: aromatic ring-hydroxylating dioxygenase subunit alpha [Planctomycetes bacterium]|nr:aromatic ring-hydroxylating dioxygenase subunit alpha [Planctomycetota bacterium]